jgi:hypothetical protein
MRKIQIEVPDNCDDGSWSLKHDSLCNCFTVMKTVSGRKYPYCGFFKSECELDKNGNVKPCKECIGVNQ